MTTPVLPDGQLTQVLIELGKLTREVAVVGTKQDALKETINSLPIADHENRLRSIERFMWLRLGASLAGGGVTGYIAAEIAKIVH